MISEEYNIFEWVMISERIPEFDDMKESFLINDKQALHNRVGKLTRHPRGMSFVVVSR